MHDIRWIRDNPDVFDRALKRRGFAEAERRELLDRLVALDESRRATIAQVQQWQEKRNRISKEIGDAKRVGNEARANELMQEVSRLKSDITNAGEEVIQSTSSELDNILAQIPNLPADDVPDGTSAEDNVERHKFWPKHERFWPERKYPFTLKQHFDLGEALGQMDFQTAAKLSGARFVLLKGGLARMERALGQFMLDLHTREHGYTEVAPPLMVRDEVMYGTAQLPKFAEDQFSVNRRLPENEFLRSDVIEFLVKAAEHPSGAFEDPAWKKQQLDLWFSIFPIEDRLWLIPTAEVPLTNLVRESIVDEAELPMRLTACTPCFRAEAGAAGKDTRGMIRQHQFDKVELVSITTPEQGRDEHERMLACAEEVLRRLDLHYRVVTLCTGDMGFPSQKTYDIEVWLPGQNMYREISSCSLCGDFQARRMNARYRSKEGRNVRHVHTLNGSGVAVGRALIAVMENYQQDNGAIAVPEVLQGYMGGLKTIERTQ